VNVNMLIREGVRKKSWEENTRKEERKREKRFPGAMALNHGSTRMVNKSARVRVCVCIAP